MGDNFYRLYFDPKSVPVVFRQPQMLQNRFKIAIIGATGVGKTALFDRLVDNTFNEQTSSPTNVPPPTSPESAEVTNADAHQNNSVPNNNTTDLGSITGQPGSRRASNDFEFDDQIESRTIDWATSDGYKLKIDMVDIKGDTPLESAAIMRDASAVMLVYSTIDRQSFLVLTEFIRSLRRNVPPDCDMQLIGTKSDQASNQRQVTVDEADSLALKHGCSLFETSAKTGVNCQAALDEIINKCRDRQQQMSNFEVDGFTMDAADKKPLPDIQGQSFSDKIHRSFCWFSRCY